MRGLTPNTEYKLTVTARNKKGASIATSTTSTPKAEPDKPANFRVASATFTSLTLAWNAPVDNGHALDGYVLELVSDKDPTANELRLLSPTLTPISSRRRSLAGVGVSGCSALRDATGGATPAGGSTNEAQSYTIEPLPEGMSFLMRLYACNEANASAGACICSRGACVLSPGCSTSAIPPNTRGRPDTPAPVTQDESPALTAERVRALFIEWALPYDNELAITDTALSIDTANGSKLGFSLGPDVTSFNLTGLEPAKQYAPRVRMLNARGWSDWSPISWLTTLPTVPDAPPEPKCDPLRNNIESLYVQLDVATDNGVAVLEYEVSLSAGDPADPILEELVYVAADADPLAFTHVNATMPPETQYLVTARARNAIGWGAPSLPGRDCITSPPVVTPFDAWLLVVPLVAVVLLLAFCMALWKYTDLPKIVAPRLRHAAVEDPLDDYIVREETPMEDLDPEITLNPVLLAKMELERARGAKRKGRRKPRPGGKGALARLGLNISRMEVKPQTEHEKGLKQLDRFFYDQNREAGGTGAAALPRTLTMHSQNRKEKARGLAAERMVNQAKASQCKAASRTMARAAAHYSSTDVVKGDISRRL